MSENLVVPLMGGGLGRGVCLDMLCEELQGLILSCVQRDTNYPMEAGDCCG
jgi:hypothetical protein